MILTADAPDTISLYGVLICTSALFVAPDCSFKSLASQRSATAAWLAKTAQACIDASELNLH